MPRQKRTVVGSHVLQFRQIGKTVQYLTTSFEIPALPPDVVRLRPVASVGVVTSPDNAKPSLMKTSTEHASINTLTVRGAPKSHDAWRCAFQAVSHFGGEPHLLRSRDTILPAGLKPIPVKSLSPERTVRSISPAHEPLTGDSMKSIRPE